MSSLLALPTEIKLHIFTIVARTDSLTILGSASSSQDSIRGASHGFMANKELWTLYEDVRNSIATVELGTFVTPDAQGRIAWPISLCARISQPRVLNSYTTNCAHAYLPVEQLKLLSLRVTIGESKRSWALAQDPAYMSDIGSFLISCSSATDITLSSKLVMDLSSGGIPRPRFEDRPFDTLIPNSVSAALEALANLTRYEIIVLHSYASSTRTFGKTRYTAMRCNDGEWTATRKILPGMEDLEDQELVSTLIAMDMDDGLSLEDGE